MPVQHKKYEAWEAYKSLAPLIRSGRVRLVFCGLPTQSIESHAIGLNSGDLFYFTHMKGAATVVNRAELERPMADHIPTLLLVSTIADPSFIGNKNNLGGRLNPRFSYTHKAYEMIGIDI